MQLARPRGIAAQLDLQICLTTLQDGRTKVDGLIEKVLELLSQENAPERRVLVERLLVALRRALEETSRQVGQGWTDGSIGPGDVGREVSAGLGETRAALQSILASDPELGLFAGDVGTGLHAAFAAAAEQFTALSRRVERNATGSLNRKET